MGWQATEALIDAGMIGATAIGTGIGLANASGADLTQPFKAAGNQVASTVNELPAFLQRYQSGQQ